MTFFVSNDFHVNTWMHLHKALAPIMLSFEFSLNVFIEFVQFSDRIFEITVKGLELAISCVRDQDAATGPARHM